MNKKNFSFLLKYKLIVRGSKLYMYIIFVILEVISFVCMQ
jgi:hypothetical protein